MKLPSRILGMVLALVMVLALALTGCTARQAAQPAQPAQPAGEPTAVQPVAIKIGTLATTDSLPLWVAEKRGYYAVEGMPSVEIVVFQSAQELAAAFASGAIDAAMTDIMMAANLAAGGNPLAIETIMLGSEPAQGRFAIVAGPKSGIKSVAELKGVPVGTASSTITEYVFDKLMAQAGVAEADIKAEEVKKMPVRFELLMSGKLKAAVLPEPFVSLALGGGATIPEGGDDTKSPENLSSSVLAVSNKFGETEKGAATIAALLKAWDVAVAEINANPDAMRPILVEKARLPKPLETTFKVDTYPVAAKPDAALVQAVLDWMKAKGYLKGELTPADLLGAKL